MELQAKPREAVERCPYCHDVIVGAVDLVSELITCAGCGTQHHEVCLLELGRCTIRGCEREIVVTRTPEIEARLASRSAIYREMHRRIKARAHEFVRKNCRPPSERRPIEWPDSPSRAEIELTEIRQVLLEAHRARLQARWLDAAAGFDEAERLISAVPQLPNQALLATTAADARSLAHDMRDFALGIKRAPSALLPWLLAAGALFVAILLIAIVPARFHLR